MVQFSPAIWGENPSFDAPVAAVRQHRDSIAAAACEVNAAGKHSEALDGIEFWILRLVDR